MSTDKVISLSMWLPIIGFLCILVFFGVSPDPFIGYLAWFIYLMVWSAVLAIQYRTKRPLGKRKGSFVIQTISLLSLLVWLALILLGDREVTLVKATIYKHTTIVRLLLVCGSSVNAIDKNGNTALGKAAANNDLETLQLLLSEGADTNLRGVHGVTASMIAASNGNQGALKMLMGKGANVAATDEYGNTALSEAVRNEHYEIVNLLLAANVDVNTTDKAGLSALMIAAGKGSLITVNELLKKSADPNLKDKSGRTALMWALEYKHQEVVERLRQASPN